jgi:hypothetical protein
MTTYIRISFLIVRSWGTSSSPHWASKSTSHRASKSRSISTLFSISCSTRLDDFPILSNVPYAKKSRFQFSTFWGIEARRCLVIISVCSFGVFLGGNMGSLRQVHNQNCRYLLLLGVLWLGRMNSRFRKSPGWTREGDASTCGCADKYGLILQYVKSHNFDNLVLTTAQ